MEKRCGCKRHSEYSTDESNLVKLSAKKIKKCVVEQLVSRSELSAKATYLCKGCAEYCEKSLLSQPNDGFDNVCKDIESGNYSIEKLQRVAEALGNSQRNSLKDAEVKYSLKSMLDFDLNKYLQNRNSVLLAFIFAMTGVDMKSSYRTLLLIAMALDCIYATVSHKSVTVLCLMVSIVTYVMSGSKALVRTLSSFMPCGSYTTLLRFLKQITETTDCSKVPEDRDIVTFFDNNQILCKNWNVEFDSKFKVSVITTSIHLLPPDITYLQSVRHFSPKVWFHTNIDKVLTVTKIRQMFLDLNGIFQGYRQSFIELILKKSYSEVQHNTDSFVNMYSYEYVQSKHKDGPTRVITGEPLFLNPCSYRAVEDVLSDIHSRNCSGQRRWSVIGCDGLPYILGTRLIDNDVNLQNILLMPGLGHFEINMVRSSFKLLWTVILQDAADMLGFRSDKAKASCRKAIDHHKSFQILEITIIACSLELVRQHVHEMARAGKEADYKSYCRFLQGVKDPNFLFLNEAIFTYLYSLFLFRAGMRMGNWEAILAGRTKFSPLFFGLHQTFYQEIEVRDLLCRVCMPPPLVDFTHDHETFTVTGVNTKGEGGDFILEAKNRKIKRMMPPGLPTKTKWKEVISNADSLDRVIKNLSLAI